MKQKRLLALVGSICLILVLALLPFMGACAKPAPAPAPTPAPAPMPAPAPTPAPEKPIELSFATPWPPAQVQNAKMYAGWIADIEEATGGRVKITLFPAGTLVKGGEMYDGTVKGICDIGASCLAYTPGRFPVMGIFDLPGISYNNAVVASLVAWEGYKELKPSELSDVKILFLYSVGPGSLSTQSPVRTLEDIQGMEIKATGNTALALKAVGAIPVAMPMPETYTAIQKGICKGFLAPPECLEGFGLGEVTKYTTSVPFMYNCVFFVAMNLDKWNSLPADIKNAFDETSEEWVEKCGLLWDEAHKQGLDFAGHKLMELAPAEAERWLALIQPVRTKYLSDIAKKGVSGGEEVLDLVTRLTEKYNEKYPEVIFK